MTEGYDDFTQATVDLGWGRPVSLKQPLSTFWLEAIAAKWVEIIAGNGQSKAITVAPTVLGNAVFGDLTNMMPYSTVEEHMRGADELRSQQ